MKTRRFKSLYFNDLKLADILQKVVENDFLENVDISQVFGFYLLILSFKNNTLWGMESFVKALKILQVFSNHVVLSEKHDSL